MDGSACCRTLNDFGWRKGWIVCVIDNLCFFKKRGNVENFSFTLIASLLFRLLNVQLWTGKIKDCKQIGEIFWNSFYSGSV